MNERLRVSFIEFLNALPLGWDFVHGHQQGRFRLLFDVPSECARHLQTGEADVGLIPVIEYQRIEGLRVIPSISIASRREVRSVLFVSRKPIEEVRTVALDTSSKTSVALLKILLTFRYQREDVDFQASRPSIDLMLERCDAALLIGNPALHLSRPDLRVYDLAAEWNRYTGKPFVFAFWAVRSGIAVDGLADSFQTGRDRGLASIDLIAANYAPKLGLTEHEIKDYLRANLDYSLDLANLDGLEHFYRLSHELGLIESVRPLEFI